MIQIQIDGTPFELSEYHASHISDTLAGATQGGSKAWEEVAYQVTRELMWDPLRETEMNPAEHAMKIAYAHHSLASALEEAYAKGNKLGNIQIVIGEAECALNASDVMHVVDTLSGFCDGGAAKWEADAVHAARQYLHVQGSPPENAWLPLERDAANAIAHCHRQLAQVINHAANYGKSRHPYCEPESCDIARARKRKEPAQVISIEIGR